MTMQKFLLLALCLLIATLASADSQTGMRGAQLERARGVKGTSSAVQEARFLKKDDEDKEEEVEEEEEEEEDDKDKDEEDDDEEEEPQEAAEAEEGEAVEAVEGNTTETEAPIAADAETSVPLTPFSLSFSGDQINGTLGLDMYLEEYLNDTFPNLIDIILTETLEIMPEEVEEMPNNVTFNVSETGEEAAIAGGARRRLVEQVVYFEGEAVFLGPPVPTEEELNSALVVALNDTDALMAFLAEALSNSTVEVGEVAIGEVNPNKVTAPEDMASSDDGLSTTGLVIVIVAAVVGGVALLVIGLVGMSTGSSKDSSL